MHARPQAPQLALSEARPVSQPLVALPSQLPKPDEQLPSVQALDTQEAEALGKTQRLPHIPQCATAVRWSTSQPLPTLPSQLPKLALHVMAAHTPPEHVGMPLVALHARPQAPQLASSVRVSTSHPSVACALQSASGAGQIPPAVHELDTQMAVRPTGAVQRFMQAPQLFASARVSVSQPSMGFLWQSAKPELHAPITQSPPEHAAPALAKRQRLPQVPQLAASVIRLTSQPVAAFRSQSPKPSRHAVCTHRLMLHAPNAFRNVVSQLTPQPEQWVLSLVRSTQLVPQRVRPVGQRHVPPPHTWPSGQRRPHIPQLLMSASRLVQPVPMQKLWPVIGQVHAPARHASPGLQARAHAPQLVWSFCRSAHRLIAGQKLVPAPGHTQRPPTQPSPGRHMFRHAPQLVGSVCRSAQLAMAAQNVWPGAEHEHPRAVHDWPAGQDVPQVPQLVGSVCRSTQRLMAEQYERLPAPGHTQRPLVHA